MKAQHYTVGSHVQRHEVWHVRLLLISIQCRGCICIQKPRHASRAYVYECLHTQTAHLVVSNLQHRLEGIWEQILESGSHDLFHADMTITIQIIHGVPPQVIGGGMAVDTPHHGGAPAGLPL